MIKHSVQELLEGKALHQEIELYGWVRTFRANRFIAINDGSSLETLQFLNLLRRHIS